MKKTTTTFAASLIALSASMTAAQAEKVTLYCSAQEDWCQLMARSFEDATGIDVNMTRKSSGETFAQIRAEQEAQRTVFLTKFAAQASAKAALEDGVGGAAEVEGARKKQRGGKKHKKKAAVDDK